ncbi:MAG: hypothetical protein ABL986_03575 [Vicinamibacterales bacterium]
MAQPASLARDQAQPEPVVIVRVYRDPAPGTEIGMPPTDGTQPDTAGAGAGAGAGEGEGPAGPEDGPLPLFPPPHAARDIVSSSVRRRGI